MDDDAGSFLGARDSVDRVALARSKASVIARLFGAHSQPQRIGRYEVRGLLGQGAMGRVYAARDPLLGRDVAIKLVRSCRCATDVRREARALARIAHPNIVAVYEVARFEQQLVIVTELVDGAPVPHWLRTQRPSRAAIVKVFIAVARGLEAVHRHGLVHGDVKPDNIMVGRDGMAKLVDFGLALETEGADEGAASGGTPGYIAPEVDAGGRATALSDQYSFCASLRNAVAVAGGPSRRLATVLERGMCQRPDARFCSMGHIVESLERAVAPRARRLAAVLPLGAATIAATLLVPDDEPTRPCADEAAAALAGVWTPQRRDKLAKVRSHKVLPLEHAIERKLQDWSEAYVQVCTHADANERAVACLRRAFDHTREVLTGFASHGAHFDLDAAHDAVAMLPSGSACMGLDTSGSTSHLQDLEREAYEQLDRIDELGGRGAFDVALSLADEVLEHGRALGDEHIILAALFAQGRYRAALLRDAEAVTAFEAAAWLAVAAGLTTAQAELAAHLVFAYAELGEHAKAAAWARQGEAALWRGGNHPGIASKLATARARLAVAEGQHELAIGHYRRALELSPPDAPPRDVAIKHAMLATTLLAVERPHDALPLYERALQMLAGSPMDSARTLLNIGRCYLALGDPRAALARIDEGLRYGEKAWAADPSLGEHLRAAHSDAVEQLEATASRSHR